MWVSPQSWSDRAGSKAASSAALKTRWSADGEEGARRETSRESWTGKTAGVPTPRASACSQESGAPREQRSQDGQAGMPESGWLLPLKNAGNKKKNREGVGGVSESREKWRGLCVVRCILLCSVFRTRKR